MGPENSTATNHDPTFAPNTFIFKYIVPNTTLEVESTLEMLEDVKKQDVSNWIEKFKEKTTYYIRMERRNHHQRLELNRERSIRTLNKKLFGY